MPKPRSPEPWIPSFVDHLVSGAPVRPRLPDVDELPAELLTSREFRKSEWPYVAYLAHVARRRAARRRRLRLAQLLADWLNDLFRRGAL